MCNNIGVALVLAEWARQQGLAAHTAYRRFRSGTLRDALDRPVRAEKRGGSILVFDPEPPPAWLDQVDPDQLVAKLRDAGYVILNAAQAIRLGLDLDPQEST
jgi:hypothetical protein